MRTLIIGTNLIGHDSCVFTVVDGNVLAASEERFTRIKHDYVFPINAIKWIIKNVNISCYDKVIFAAATKTFANLKVPRTFYQEEQELRTYLSKKLKRQVYIKDILKIRKLSKWKKFKVVPILKYGILRKLGFVSEALLSEVFVNEVRKIIPESVSMEVRFYDHHLCHALGAVEFAPFKTATVITYFIRKNDGRKSE